MILGIDEVGRGPWAGPLVVGAVVLDDARPIEGLTDSKKLTAKRRQALDVLIREQAAGWGLGWVTAQEIDDIGLSAALKLATIRAVEQISCAYHEIIIDGTINFLQETSKGQFVSTLPKADLLVPAVSAASIMAKVARDAYMEEQADVFPGYGFERNAGYGTALHRAGLAESGVTPLHRKSFAPIKALLTGKADEVPTREISPKTSKSIGDVAESQAAAWLIDNGFNLVARNWKNRYCEIDCIARKNNTLYFVEVKFRSSDYAGGAIETITDDKQRRMSRAAEVFGMSDHNYKSDDYVLAVLAVEPGRPLSLLILE